MDIRNVASLMGRCANWIIDSFSIGCEYHHWQEFETFNALRDRYDGDPRSQGHGGRSGSGPSTANIVVTQLLQRP